MGDRDRGRGDRADRGERRGPLVEIKGGAAAGSTSSNSLDLVPQSEDPTPELAKTE